MLDGWIDGSLSADKPDAKVGGTLVLALLAVVAVPAQIELSGLIGKTGARIFLPISIISSVLLVSCWYVGQFFANRTEFMFFYLAFVCVFSILSVFLYQGVRFDLENVLANCGASLFSIFYLGFLSSFVMGLKIDFGPWCLLMFVFVVKFADIGAYTVGSLFGRHKFSPKISPGKTWEGMAGAVAASVIVSLAFAAVFDTMSKAAAILFGIVFAFAGQLGDLAESMIKRDAGLKDSAATVPGFGGVLDVIDSLVITAAPAYLFFMLLR